MLDVVETAAVMGVFEMELRSDEYIHVSIIDTVVFVTIIAVVCAVHCDLCREVPGIVELVSSLKSDMGGEVVSRLGADIVSECLRAIAVSTDVFHSFFPYSQFLFLKTVGTIITKAYDANKVEAAALLVFVNYIGEVD